MLYEVIAVVISVLLVTVGVTVMRMLGIKINLEEYNRLYAAVCAFVKAAEQLFTAPGSGEEKKAWVLKNLDKSVGGLLVKHLDDANAMIEQSVYDMNNGLIEYED